MKKLLLSLALVLLALPAAAQMDMEWNITASAGEVDESALGIYDYSGARLQFQPGASGQIVARYPGDQHEQLHPRAVLGHAPHHLPRQQRVCLHHREAGLSR